MLNPGSWVKGGALTATRYLTAMNAGDYYRQRGQSDGHWYGRGAKRRNLHGAIEPDSLVCTLDGRDHVTGVAIGERRNEQRRTHKDFVFSAPKEMTLAAALASEARRMEIEAIHDDAVRAALTVAEKYAAARDRRPGAEKHDVIMTANLIVAIYRHDTARPVPGHLPDPQMHSHCLFANLTETENGSWLALEDSVMLAHQAEISATYDAVAAEGMRKLGYTPVWEGKSWRLAEIDKKAANLLSKRHNQIEETAQARADMIEAKTGKRPSPEAVKEIVAHEAREKKLEHLSPDNLRADWRRQLRGAGLREDGWLAEPAQRMKAPLLKTAHQAVAQAVAHLTEREAVVSEQAVVVTATRFALGSGLTPERMRREIERRVRSKSLLRAGDQLTTAEALAEEERLVERTRAGRGKGRPIVGPDFLPDSSLSVEQAEAERAILTSHDLTMLLRGAAGTGKSTLLRAITNHAATAGHTVLVCAPTGRQARGLQADGFNAQTLATLLTRPLPHGTMVICDEAGQAGIADLRRLQSAVESAGGRLLLCGDSRQHGSVARGDALRQLERDGGVTKVELSSIRRQDASRGRNEAERRYIKSYREAATLASQGNAQESYDLMDAVGSVREVADPLAEAACVALDKGKDGTVMVVTQTRTAVTSLNAAIRAQRVAAGEVAAEGWKVAAYMPTDTTLAQRQDLASYKPGTLIAWAQKHGDMARGSVVELTEVDSIREQIVVRDQGGKTRRVGLSAAQKWRLVEMREIEIAPGDQLLLKQNASVGRGKSVTNGEVVGVRSLKQDGAIVLADDRVLPASYRHFDHGYASTSFTGQGRTVEHVVVADSGSRRATSSRQWYVDLSRGRRSATVLTADREALRTSIGRSGDAALATDLGWERQPTPRERLTLLAKKFGGTLADAGLAALQKSGLSPLLARLQISSIRSLTSEVIRIRLVKNAKDSEMAKNEQLPSIAHWRSPIHSTPARRRSRNIDF